MNNGLRLLAALVLSALILTMALMCVRCVDANAQEQVTVTVRDFGKGMTPVMSGFTNDPERIVYSENLYSTQPGTRQLRFGHQPFITYAATGDPNDSAVDAMALFLPSDDSSALVYAAGGYYHRIKTGAYRYRTGDLGGYWTVADDTSYVINPYNGGDSVTVNADTSDSGVKGYGTQWVKFLQPGDSAIFTLGDSTWRSTIRFVIGDDSLELNDTIKDTADVNIAISGVQFKRLYTQGGQEPYLLQAGDYMYTGTNADPPQVIFSDDDTPYLRPLGIVDSMYIDSVYFSYEDTVRGNSRDTAFVNATDTIIVVTRMQLVDRSKTWVPDIWASDIENNPKSYYVRLAVGGSNMYKVFQIVGNSDSSLFCPVAFVDTAGICTPCVLGDWPGVDEMPDSSILDGTKAYILSAVGATKTVFSSDDTESLLVVSGGVMLHTLDTLFTDGNEDTLQYGNYWIRALEPVSLPRAERLDYYTITHTWRPGVEPEPDRPTVPSGDAIVSEVLHRRLQRPDPDRRGSYITYFQNIYTVQGPVVERSRVLEDRYFHINRAWVTGDTTYFHTDGPYRVTDTVLSSSDSVWIHNWELLKSEMPYFSGMTEFDNRLMAWGDTLQPGTINMSRRFNHWDWTQVDEDGTPMEFFLTNATSDPIVNIIPYDDRAVVYRSHSILSYPDFGELSLSEGLAAHRAVVGLNKYLYWLDVDGVYRMQRRDFNGYSVQKISYEIDPIFSAWNQTVFGGTVSPVVINPDYRYKSILVHNQRDRHLYLFFPAGSSTTNNKCLTYDLQREQWDGVLTLGASAALWATVEDTSRILLGSNDSAWITKLDYSYLDPDSTGVDSHLKSGGFHIADANGLPVMSRLARIDFSGRAIQGGVDSVKIIVGHWGSRGVGADTLKITTFSAIYPDIADNFTQRCYNSVSAYWDWDIYSWGRDGGVSTFQPFELKMTFLPLRKDGL